MCCRYLLLRDNLRDLLAQLGVPEVEWRWEKEGGGEETGGGRSEGSGEGKGDGAHFLGNRDSPHFADNYNIAPCAKIPVVRAYPPDGKRECVSLLWNFAPARMARPAGPANTARPLAPLFNARAETLWEKPAFREAARSRRCLVPAGGFYEWARVGRARLPWLFQMRGAKPFFMAGIWERDTCAIITTAANALMRPVHDRMPAIIAAADAAAWLEDGDASRARLLLAPFDAERMTARRVSTHVNNVRNRGAACVAPPDGDASHVARDDGSGTLPLFQA